MQLPQHPHLPTSHPTGPRTITSQMAAPRRTSAEASLPGFLNNLRTFANAPEAKQLSHLSNVCQTLHPLLTPTDHKNNLPWVLKRMTLFLTLPHNDQLKYMRDLIHWRQAVFAPQPLTDVAYIAYLLPGLAHYVRSIRTGTYDETRDKNWFIWWKLGQLKRREEEGTQPGDEIVADRKLLEHLLQYENMQGRAPVAPPQIIALPPISEILRPGRAWDSRVPFP
ncbi:hypothetical protein F5Y06DRAFT_303740 [Hypoxylon sp. FL0890]|nr:hypothetical protein F5Y06DRAFT_303740 [Hypoxylon sp. FL0890]